MTEEKSAMLFRVEDTLVPAGGAGLGVWGTDPLLPGLLLFLTLIPHLVGLFSLELG